MANLKKCIYGLISPSVLLFCRKDKHLFHCEVEMASNKQERKLSLHKAMMISLPERALGALLFT